MERSDRQAIGLIKHLPSFAANVDKTHVAQNSQVFRNRRLGQPESCHYFSHGTLLERQIVEDVAAPRFCDRVENVRGGGCPSHSRRLYSHMRICQAYCSTPESETIISLMPLLRLDPQTLRSADTRPSPEQAPLARFVRPVNSCPTSFLIGLRRDRHDKALHHRPAVVAQVCWGIRQPFLPTRK